MIEKNLSELLAYAKTHLHLDEADTVYCTNLIMQRLGLTDYASVEVDEKRIASLRCPDEVILPIVNYAKEQGIVSEGEEEFFSSEILDILSPRPSETRRVFSELYARSPKSAFDYLYDLGVKNDYVKLSAIEKNKYWLAESTKNKIEITINLSKPEKNNKLTAKLKNVSSGYPKCMLCEENLGYEGQGRTRRNMRTVPLTLAGEEWFWQYSPYAYFYQHGIAINKTHTPMTITKTTFRKILDFVDYIPDFFIGTNAPLPIVGGSILAHEHFQGGNHVFPMFLCPTRHLLHCPVDGVTASIPDWYNSVILLEGQDKDLLTAAGNAIYEAWEHYSDEPIGILAHTDAPHNTVAAIARKTEKGFSLYLQLRNNRCNDEHPDGIFHAHKEYHNIKSESIGLIEAMGRFILPGRLDRQLKEVEKFLTGERNEIGEDISIHADMIKDLLNKFGNKNSADEAKEIVKKRVEDVCEDILRNTAVFKDTDEGEKGFFRFLSLCGYTKA